MVKRRNMRKTQKGAGYSFGHAIAPEAPYAQEVIGGPKLTPDCLAATRPGLVSTLPGTGGLPGFAGGARSLVNSDGIAQAIGSPVMNGGGYTFDLAADPIATSAGPSLGGYPVVSRIGCEGGLVNTSPPGAHANPTPLQNGGVGGVDSAYYTAPTAGYGNTPSSWTGSTGSPSLLQIPYDARIANPACNKTGGGGKKTRNRKSRKSNKSRKSRKSRKTRR
jgi:hypothetical protein